MIRLSFLTIAVVSWLCFSKSLAKDSKEGSEDFEVVHPTSRSMAQSYAYANNFGQGPPMPGQPMQIPRPIPYKPTVQCYTCADCPNILPSTPTKQCPYTNDLTKQNKCIVYAEQYKHMKQELFIRGCASERNTCAEIKKAHSSNSGVVKLIKCRECEGDKCNSVSRSLPDLAMAFIVVMVCPFLMKHTIS